MASSPDMWRDLELDSDDTKASLIKKAPYLKSAQTLSLLYPPACVFHKTLLMVTLKGLTNAGFEQIANHCQHLKVIDLSWTKVDDNAIMLMNSLCTEVTSLSLKGTKVLLCLTLHANTHY